ncbi:Uncharacterised protein [Mycobacteroides abscessus]|nr:Uncharacterised protein [Mycobacteroides abscessus]
MSLVDPSRFAPWHCPPPLFRNIELGRIEVSSGRLAIRDVYDRDHPQVVLNVAPGNYRVWSTELDLRANPRARCFGRRISRSNSLTRHANESTSPKTCMEHLLPHTESVSQPT